jgi:hypothetical protein
MNGRYRAFLVGPKATLTLPDGTSSASRKRRISEATRPVVSTSRSSGSFDVKHVLLLVDGAPALEHCIPMCLLICMLRGVLEASRAAIVRLTL